MIMRSLTSSKLGAKLGPALSMGVATAAGRHKAEGAEGADVAFNDEHLKDFKIFGRIITKQDANSLNMS